MEHYISTTRMMLYTNSKVVVLYPPLYFLHIYKEVYLIMEKKPQLLLDMGGVLVENLTEFWDEVVSIAKSPYTEVRAKYKAEMSDKLWSGSISEEGFWIWLTNNYPSIDKAHIRNSLIQALKPLPAFNLLKEWSKYADIHILSNHRAEWIKPILAPVDKHITSIIISSEVGYFKPNPAIYEQAITKMTSTSYVLFVDDKEKNLEIARQIGWQTLLADSRGLWSNKVIPFLKDKKS